MSEVLGKLGTLKAKKAFVFKEKVIRGIYVLHFVLTIALFAMYFCYH
jgi:hypothetical protein